MQTDSLLSKKKNAAIPPVSADGEFTQPVPDAAQIAKAAEKELGAFLVAVGKIFGNDKIDSAASLWIQHFEIADCLDSDVEEAFRRVTIQTAAQMAMTKEASVHLSVVPCAASDIPMCR